MLWQRRRVTPCELKMQRFNTNLAQKQFVTLQQSIVEISDATGSGRVHGIEVLNRPLLGEEFSSVEEFYSFGASHGQSMRLDTYTLQLGLERLANSRANLQLEAHPGRVFVNVHLSTLFSEEWKQLLNNFPLPTSQVVLELSEREGLNTYSEHDVAFVTGEVQGSGMKIAVDDVGVGYSGLHTLAMVHPDYVKIDRQLVTGVDQDAYRQHMMTALVEYWRNENVTIIAEGIERPEEADFFREIGVRLAQGYWFHRPEPMVEAALVGC